MYIYHDWISKYEKNILFMKICCSFLPVVGAPLLLLAPALPEEVVENPV